MFELNIPNGTYANYTELAAQIEVILNNAGTGAGPWTVVYDTSTFIITITSTANADLRWNSGPNSSTTIGVILGYNVSVDTGAVLVHTATTPVGGGPSGPLWILYKCLFDQCYRFNTNKDAVHFRVFDSSGTTLNITDTSSDIPVDPLQQVSAIFQITPYIREGNYDNHLTTMYM